MPQVKLGRRFFQSAIKDYADPHWAFAREVLQNAIDSGATQVDVKVSEPRDNQTAVTVTDNGCGMTSQVLTEKLLTLGESGKEFASGSVGGFGKAKELLFFYHHHYVIHTNGLRCVGEGADYEITSVPPGLWPSEGTQVQVWWEGDHFISLAEAFTNFLGLTDAPDIQFTLNGFPISADLASGTHKRDTGFGAIYTTPQLKGKVVVRINGTPMFTRNTSYKSGVVVELSGTSEERLTANRDGLRSPFCWQLDEFLTQLSVDRKSALRNQRSTYKRYEGPKLAYRAADASLVVDALMPPSTLPRQLFDRVNEAQQRQVTSGLRSTTLTSENGPAIELGHEFIIKNTTGLQTPNFYLPDRPEFGTYARTLAKWWVRLLVLLHEVTDTSASFSVGFVLDEENEAEFEKGNYGPVYYLNPATMVTQQTSASRSFKNRQPTKSQVLAVAVHEFIHGLGYSRHDENWGSKMTEIIAVVFDNYQRFQQCFK